MLNELIIVLRFSQLNLLEISTWNKRKTLVFFLDLYCISAAIQSSVFISNCQRLFHCFIQISFYLQNLMCPLSVSNSQVCTLISIYIFVCSIYYCCSKHCYHASHSPKDQIWRETFFSSRNRNGNVTMWLAPMHVSSLQHLCRMSLRRVLNSSQVDAITLPTRLKTFLKYVDQKD